MSRSCWCPYRVPGHLSCQVRWACLCAPLLPGHPRSPSCFPAARVSRALQGLRVLIPPTPQSILRRDLRVTRTLESSVACVTIPLFVSLLLLSSHPHHHPCAAIASIDTDTGQVKIVLRSRGTSPGTGVFARWEAREKATINVYVPLSAAHCAQSRACGAGYLCSNATGIRCAFVMGFVTIVLAPQVLCGGRGHRHRVHLPGVHVPAQQIRWPRPRW
jgi:hypothetical protein